MREYVWLFPVIFIFHEMEELVGFNLFLRKNGKELKENAPRIYSKYKDFSTEGLAFAVYEELIVCILLCIFPYFLNKNWLWYLWLGAFLGCDLHYFKHLIQMSLVKKYIPSCITSLLCLPVNTLIICKCLTYIEGPYLFPAIFIAAGILLEFLNLRFVRFIVGWFTRKNHLAQN
ncbi:MAG: HXXEE domain-containing protein [Treponema sp.]|nr:HXXEE domain-containing protein [Treponema sp.]